MMMTTGVLGSQRIRLCAAIALAGGLLASAPAAAADTSCDVKNLRSRTHHDSLQAAVSSADAGDRLRVVGTCVGSTVVDRSLVIVGARRTMSGRPILDGGHAGRVLQVGSGVTVHLKGLVIRRGEVSGEFGGGILNHGHLTLRNVVVAANRADSGGGIHTTGDVVMNGTTSVERNRAMFDDGGGIHVDGGSLTMNDSSSIHDNECGRGGGGVYGVSAALTLNAASSVHDNQAATGGGGIYVDFWSTLVMNGTSSVHHNLASENGGGVFDGSSVTMNDSSSIDDNTATWRGGGVFVGCYAELTGADAGGNLRRNRRSNLANESGCP